MLKKRKNKWIKQLRSPENWLSTEQMRMIRMNIQNEMNDKRQVLMVTSPEENQWQVLFSSKLASSFAEAGKKVLLVDMNFSRPIVHHLFGIRNENGLSNILRGEEGRVTEAFIQNLDILPAGSFSSYLEGLDEIEQLISAWQRYYDVIILETPAFLKSADSQILSLVCSGVILVLQEGQTKEEDALEVKKILERANTRLVGAVYQTN
ncbi:CpsD/CapB family tyrosine-protein kinase [Metabacillus fastidiosus]|uniref:CpsD/CapB family tyrosine-protein kinase n=1 Tax=Metabacillus fastidiosus TaxID=1458 RepID=UPI003D2E6A32